MQIISRKLNGQMISFTIEKHEYSCDYYVICHKGHCRVSDSTRKTMGGAHGVAKRIHEKVVETGNCGKNCCENPYLKCGLSF